MASTDARPVPQKNVAYRVYFPIFDNTGALVTSAAGLDSEVSKDGAAFADCTNEATEIDSSGTYYLDLTSTEMNADAVVVIVKTSTTDAKTTPIFLYPEEAGDIRVNVTAFGGTAGTFASGIPEVKVNNIAANAITATSIASDAITDAKVASDVTIASVTGAVGSVTGNVGGNVTGSVGSVATGGITAASIADGAIDRATFAVDTGLQTTRSNTAQAGAAGTVTLDASASSVTDFYKGMCIYLTSGTGSGQARVCTAYNGTTKVATITPNWATNPDNTSTFAVMETAASDLRTISGSAVSTSTAQLGVNAVQAGGTAWGSGAITAASIATDAITSAKIAADAIGASELASDAGTEIATAVWANATRTVSAATNITSTGGSVPITAGGLVNADVAAISTDTAAADNAESFFDGTGYAGTNNVIPTVTTVNGLAANTVNASALASDAVTEIQSGLATASALSTAQTDITTIKGYTDDIGVAGAGLTALASAANLSTAQGNITSILADTNELQTDWANGGRLDLILDARASQTSVDDLPTNAELTAALASADDATLAAVAALNNLSSAQVQTAAAAALTAYDPPTRTEATSDANSILTAIDALPTNAELATALGTADDAVLAAISPVATKVDELHKIQGLDISNPMTVTTSTREAGTIELAITGDGTTTTTVTRQ